MFDDSNFGDFADNGEDVGFSFEALEKLEAEKSSKSLKELDMKLFSDSDPTAVRAVDEGDGRSPRYYSAGYDANYECVEDKEILQWKRAFPYLHVVGKGLGFSSQDAESAFDSMPPSVDMNTFREDGTFVCDETLVVIGKAATIHAAPRDFNTDAYGDSEEVILVHGVLEEHIAVDHSNEQPEDLEETPDLNDVNLCSNPSETQRDEVVSGLFSMIWPEIVDGMKPLIQKVLKLAKDNNVSLEDYRQSNLDDCEVKCIGKKRSANRQEDNEFEFNDDDQW